VESHLGFSTDANQIVLGNPELPAAVQPIRRTSPIQDLAEAFEIEDGYGPALVGPLKTQQATHR
jgi:hypothetical protein